MPTFHTCEICDADGKVLANGIRLALDEEDRGSGPPWFGTLTVTHHTLLTAGQTYRIVLDDGRAGSFRVRRNTFAGDASRAVAADGVEPLRAAAR